VIAHAQASSAKKKSYMAQLLIVMHETERRAKVRADLACRCDVSLGSAQDRSSTAGKMGEG
jgi:hypothetical protein